MKEEEKDAESLWRDDASRHLLVHIGPHIERTRETNRRDDEQDECGQGIDIHKGAERDDRAMREDLSGQGRIGADQCQHGREVDDMQEARTADHETEQAGDERAQ